MGYVGNMLLSCQLNKLKQKTNKINAVEATQYLALTDINAA